MLSALYVQKPDIIMMPVGNGSLCAATSVLQVPQQL
jgi:hypothetical protein